MLCSWQGHQASTGWLESYRFKQGMGRGHWQQKCPELLASGPLYTPSNLCGLPKESLSPLRVRAPPPFTLPLLWPGPAFKV